MKRLSPAFLILLPLLACYSPRDDLDQLCLVTDVVLSEPMGEDLRLPEIDARYRPRTQTIKNAWAAVAAAAEDQRWPLLLAAAREVDYPDWDCPQLKALLQPSAP